ncbi:hypothetical protein GOODEAATRI_025014, partial [Goodea atripinnis]
RKQITIRDPNQGGRDITKEIMSGGRSTTAATPPQSVATTAATERLSPSIKERQSPPPLPSAAAAGTSSVAEAVNKLGTNAGDTVDAPVSPPASLVAQETPVKTEEPQAAPFEKEPEHEEVKQEGVKKLEKEGQTPGAMLEPPAEVAATAVETVKEDTAAKPSSDVSLPLTVPEPAAPQTKVMDQSSEPEPAPVNLAEPPLSNGLPQETEELSEDIPVSDTTPQDKPDASQSQESTPVAKTATPAPKEEDETREEEPPPLKKKTEVAPLPSASCPDETTMQGEVEMIFTCLSSLLLGLNRRCLNVWT